MNNPDQVPKAQYAHPSDDTLSDLVRNELSTEDTVVVQKHVARCKRCQLVIDEFRMEDAEGGHGISTASNEKVAKTTQAEKSTKAKDGQVSNRSSEKKPGKQTVVVPEELRNHAQYKVVSLIGKGGMGNVFLVEHKLTARKEVLKVIHSHLLSREDIRIRFKREIQSAAKLNHPNVVQTLTAIEEGRMIGMVMEYIHGESLSSMVKRVGPLPLDTVRDMVTQIAKGLDHAHSKDMVHRDIKPQNVLVSKEGKSLRARILDFGLAKTTSLAAANSDLTIDGTIIGTPNYMAPEQAINPSLADIRSDIYSLGCVWFFLLTGKPPFESDSPLAIMNAHQNSSCPLVHSLRSGVPEETQRILSKMMAKLPEDRFQCPSELIDALASTAIAPSSERTSRSGQSDSNSSVLNFDLLTQNKSRPKPKPKAESKVASLIRIAMFAIPSITLAGILTFRSHWITNLGDVLKQIDSQSEEPLTPGQARIVLTEVPLDVQVFIDNFPAKFERSRADSQPSISARPGTYLLSVRRHDQVITDISISLVANQVLELNLGRTINASLRKSSEHIDIGQNSRPSMDAKTSSEDVQSFVDTTDFPEKSEEKHNEGVSESRLGEEVVLGKRFVMQQRLIGHKSPVIRIAHQSDGNLISAERNGQPFQRTSKTSALQTLSQICLWSKDGSFLSLPSEGTLEDFLRAPNGRAILHIGRVFGNNLTAQLYKDGRSIWTSSIAVPSRSKSNFPHFSFSADSDELLMVSPEGSFTRLNLRTGKNPPPTASFIAIDKSTVESISTSPKLDHVLFCLTSGELLVVRTRDGKQIMGESSNAKVSTATSTPVIAAQFNSRDNRIATVHSNGIVRFFEFPSLNQMEDLPQTLHGSIAATGRSSNGRFLVAIAENMRVSVYDLDEGKLFASWEMPKVEKATSVSIDILGKRIAIGFDSGSIALFQSAKE